MEGARDGGEEKAPPCLVTAAGAFSASLPTKIQLEPAHAGILPARQKQMASGRRRSGGTNCIAAALLMVKGDGDGDGGGEGRSPCIPSAAEVTHFAVAEVSGQVLWAARILSAHANEKQAWLGIFVNLYIFNQSV